MFDDRVYRRIGKLGEILRFPVVRKAGLGLRCVVERLLEVDVGHRLDRVNDGRPERAERLQDTLAFGEPSSPADADEQGRAGI